MAQTAQFKISLGEMERTASADELDQVCREMVVANSNDGNGLHVEPLTVPEPSSQVRAKVLTRPRQAAVTAVDVVGQARAQLDEQTAREAGFSPKPPLYTIGTRVNALGVENARRSRLEYEAKPLVTDACGATVARVDSEHRRERTVLLNSLTMNPDGTLCVQGRKGAGQLHMTPRALGQIVNRLGCGGAEYFAKCWTALRAENLNAWLAKAAADDAEKNVTLRVRDVVGGGREVYAAVSERYQSGFGADMIAKAIGRAVSHDARGSVDYDGYRARFEVLFHSDVLAEEYVAGEIFKAGVVVRTDDAGGGGVQVSAVVWRNLCLNLIVIDQAEQKIASLRHVGDVLELAKKFKAAFDTALSKIGAFKQAWGYAMHEDVVARTQGVTPTEELEGLPIGMVLPGIFNGLIERELVPLKGPRKQVLKSLSEMYAREPTEDRRLSRASIVNALTRYAHEGQDDPWAEDEIQRSAGALLFGVRGKEPAPLPYVAVS